MPKFLSFNLPYTNEVDSKFISKRLLRSALNKRQEVRKRLCKYFTDFKYEIVIRRSIYIEICIRHNVGKAVNNVISTHGKKLKI